jgi:hypothetical protein
MFVALRRFRDYDFRHPQQTGDRHRVLQREARGSPGLGSRHERQAVAASFQCKMVKSVA